MPRPRIVKGKGVTGALGYVMSEGVDPATERRRQLAEGATPRAEILGGQGFGFAVENEADLELARWVKRAAAAPDHKTFKCVKDCFHVSLSWEKGADPSRACDVS